MCKPRAGAGCKATRAGSSVFLIQTFGEFNMKMKEIILAGMLAVSCVGAYAANYEVDLGSASSGNTYSGVFGATQTVAGAFEDTFTFTPAVTGWATGSLITTSFNTHDD